MVAKSKTALSRERLRRRYRPARVRLLVVGEVPPASGRFFYQADSGLCWAVRDAFARVFPKVDEGDFLASFRGLGCYLVVLGGRPVDHLSRQERNMAYLGGEARLARTLKQLSPEIAITVVQSVGVNVKRSEARANWHGQHIKLPYPGRWQRPRTRFLRELTVVLRDSFRRPPPVRSQ